MDEQLRILKMVEEGTITAEQGANLMAAMHIDQPPAAPAASSYDKKMFRVIVDSETGTLSTGTTRFCLRWMLTHSRIRMRMSHVSKYSSRRRVERFCQALSTASDTASRQSCSP